MFIILFIAQLLRNEINNRTECITMNYFIDLKSSSKNCRKDSTFGNCVHGNDLLFIVAVGY